jgi:hypothetical protein
MTTIFHEVEKSKLDEVLKEGLKKQPRGSKGNDENMVKADEVLDAKRPLDLKEAGVSRDNNLYGYLLYRDKIVDITDGSLKDINKLSQSSEQVLLKVNVDDNRCYVADLDLYDQIIEVINNAVEGQFINDLTHEYWQKLTRLDHYDHTNGFKRPEVMVTYDVPANHVEVIKS